MTKQKQSLLAAIASTVCAATWLANLAVDVILRIEPPGQTALHALSTVIWAVCAGLWWVRWFRERSVRVKE